MTVKNSSTHNYVTHNYVMSAHDPLTTSGTHETFLQENKYFLGAK